MESKKKSLETDSGYVTANADDLEARMKRKEVKRSDKALPPEGGSLVAFLRSP